MLSGVFSFLSSFVYSFPLCSVLVLLLLLARSQQLEANRYLPFANCYLLLSCYFVIVNFVLTPIECRVLGALVEKDITTPDYYPLSLNALVNACNQKNNRDPVMNLEEDSVRQALHSLQEKRLAGPAGGADSRVTKYEHRLQEAYNFSRPEIAVLCVLFLRGPQTPGELRGRGERMYAFGGLDEVGSTLQRLGERQMVKMLPRQPGTKESRYAHLFAGDVEGWEPPAESHAASGGSADSERITRLEEEVASLKNELADLREQMTAFRKQFE